MQQELKGIDEDFEVLMNDLGRIMKIAEETGNVQLAFLAVSAKQRLTSINSKVSNAVQSFNSALIEAIFRMQGVVK